MWQTSLLSYFKKSSKKGYCRIIQNHVCETFDNCKALQNAKKFSFNKKKKERSNCHNQTSATIIISQQPPHQSKVLYQPKYTAVAKDSDNGQHFCVCVHAKLLQQCLTLTDPMDYSSPGSSVHGDFPGENMEWIAIPSSRRSS